MKTILILGAGRSSSSLIDYTIDQANANGWNVVVGDISLSAAQEKIGNATNAKAIEFDIYKDDSADIIRGCDVVISLMPAHLHVKVARHCLVHSKHLITASYVSNDMQDLHAEATLKGLLFLNECGLDPGIDHMSAMQVIDRIRNSGGVIESFESFTGGLIAPETDPDNPWRYKFTWNPRNVVMAGQGTACFLQEGEFKYIPYQQLFKRTTPVHVDGYGDYEGYANRDSLKYISTYSLTNIKTMLRGTLRNHGYCDTWHILALLGCCDDSYKMEGVDKMTHRNFINSFLAHSSSETVEQKLIRNFDLVENDVEMSRLKWSGFFDNELVGLNDGTPAQITEHILNKKWRLQPQDKDMIVMWHRFRFVQHGARREIQATLVAKGDNSTNTAMAKTVGLPMAIAAKLLLQGKVQTCGVVIPVSPEFYNPILDELSTLGITLAEKES